MFIYNRRVKKAVFGSVSLHLSQALISSLLTNSSDVADFNPKEVSRKLYYCNLLVPDIVSPKNKHHVLAYCLNHPVCEVLPPSCACDRTLFLITVKAALIRSNPCSSRFVRDRFCILTSSVSSNFPFYAHKAGRRHTKGYREHQVIACSRVGSCPSITSLMHPSQIM